MSPEIDTDYYNSIQDDPLVDLNEKSNLHCHTFDKPPLKPSKFEQIKSRMIVKTMVVATFLTSLPKPKISASK